MTSATHPASTSAAASRGTRIRTLGLLAAAVVVAVGINTLVALTAVRLGADASFAPLTLPVYGSFTLAGVVIGWVGWSFVQRRAARPRRALAVLVPAVGLASFAPDIVLMVTGFIPHTTTTGVVALMAMHVVVIAVAVPAYALASSRRR